MTADLAALLLRLALGVIFVMHGYKHGFGPKGLTGTTTWFADLGLRPARFHAAASTYLEIAAGVALLVGLFTPAAAAVGIGIMATAFMTVHRANGFFITKEGYEYVVLVATALTVLSMMGPGSWSLDHAFGLDRSGWQWGVGAFVLGALSTAGLLITSWRPHPPTD
ncbi:MAG: DoxX family protein [Aeromicrobium sp.]|uniref:DoxX family protein n=1 Tax=Aeromicrobium sp. TaxID=1871063 RepID=UPI003C5EE510